MLDGGVVDVELDGAELGGDSLDGGGFDLEIDSAAAGQFHQHVCDVGAGEAGGESLGQLQAHAIRFFSTTMVLPQGYQVALVWWEISSRASSRLSLRARLTRVVSPGASAVFDRVGGLFQPFVDDGKEFDGGEGRVGGIQRRAGKNIQRLQLINRAAAAQAAQGGQRAELDGLVLKFELQAELLADRAQRLAEGLMLEVVR